MYCCNCQALYSKDRASLNDRIYNKFKLVTACHGLNLVDQYLQCLYRAGLREF